MALFEKKKKEQVDPAPVTKATLTRSIVSSAFILTILSVAVLAYITTAWFSSNRKVDNTGVHMNIQTSPNMIIADGHLRNYTTFSTMTVMSEFKYDASDEVKDTSISVNFNDTEDFYVPATHNNANDSVYGLKYNTNPSDIDFYSGLATSGYTVGLADVTANTSPKYFLEHKVLIASTDGTLSANALTATFSANPVLGNEPDYSAQNYAETTNQHLYRYATSVDFYVKTVTKNQFNTATTAATLATTEGIGIGTYAGTLNLAGKDSVGYNAESNTAGSPKTTLILRGGNNESNITIPWNGTTDDNADCCIVVTMRFYFDGALLQTQDLDTPVNNKTYVHSAYLDTQGMPELLVKFEATAPVTPPVTP